MITDLAGGPHETLPRRRMEAIYRLAWLREPSGLVPVNWRDMETEELGSVYESQPAPVSRHGALKLRRQPSVRNELSSHGGFLYELLPRCARIFVLLPTRRAPIRRIGRCLRSIQP